MRALRSHPDLDQLRRQARELLRQAGAGGPRSGGPRAPGAPGEPGARRAANRFGALDAPLTLAGAQLVVAREHGFPSWARLKAEVERRRSEDGAPRRFVLRSVRTPEELRELWGVVHVVLGASPPPARPHWRVFEDFDEKRPSLVAVEHDGRIIGGSIQLQLLAIPTWARGIGLGRRLVQTVEGTMLARGKPLALHADPENKGFFLRLGYHERGASKRHLSRGAPESARLLERRLALWRARLGDLDAGVVVEVDPETGRIPPLPW